MKLGEVHNEEEDEDAKDQYSRYSEVIGQPLVLAAKGTELGKHNELLVANALRVEVVDDLDFVRVVRSHDTVHASVELQEVSFRFHLIPYHQVLVFNIRPVIAFRKCILISFKLCVCIYLVSNVRIIYGYIKHFAFCVCNPGELVIEEILRNEAAWPSELVRFT